MKSVALAPWSDAWPRNFASVREALQVAFAPTAIAVEHIGSTAVAGLSAKPVIDVLLGAASLLDIEMRIDALRAAGFAYVSKYEVEIPERRYFVRESGDSQRVHVHGVVQGSTIWMQHLAFRDALRSDAALREEYQALKLQLARQFAHDKAAYTDAKAPFIQAVLARELQKIA